MTQFSEQRLDQVLTQIKGKKIAVVGDLMLDRYIWGKVGRISPEAPVVVVDVESEQARLGGAANVARNIQSLGGTPLLIGITGDDNSGRQLMEIVRECKFPIDGILYDASRPTTVKTRIIAEGQHVVRIDRESRKEISAEVQTRLLGLLTEHIGEIDGIIIEDYNKGVIVQSLIHKVTALANAHKKVITIDPKFNNFFEYRNVTVFKPNRKEVEAVLGMRIDTDEEVVLAGKKILEKLDARNVLLTRGEHGMTLIQCGGDVSHVPTKARRVADVSGAGDTVIATLTLALVGEANILEAAALANFAGGVVCGYVGIVPITPAELRSAVLDDSLLNGGTA